MPNGPERKAARIQRSLDHMTLDELKILRRQYSSKSRQVEKAIQKAIRDEELRNQLSLFPDIVPVKAPENSGT